LDSWVVVVGASAGGYDALTEVLNGLPGSFPAPVLVVLHHGMGADDARLTQLRRVTDLTCVVADEGDEVRPAHVHFAPRDHHLVLAEKSMRIVRGARENRMRPSIDVLFRSAAVEHRTRVIGVVLTGHLDDGTAGLTAIHRCGGVCVTQDPRDARHPDMPRSALQNVDVDHCVALKDVASVLVQTTSRRPGPARPVPRDVAIEAAIAARVLTDSSGELATIGSKSMHACPDCGGVLSEIPDPSGARFRCHTGHAYSCRALVESLDRDLETTLWTALRMFEERRNLLLRMMATSPSSGSSGAERVAETQAHIDRLRGMLVSRHLGDDAEFAAQEAPSLAEAHCSPAPAGASRDE
jgi:two-component system, chemotaxis family, protein-glutamate methylesterase/glutaminase